jgi:hypothetical protein
VADCGLNSAFLPKNLRIQSGISWNSTNCGVAKILIVIKIMQLRREHKGLLALPEKIPTLGGMA